MERGFFWIKFLYLRFRNKHCLKRQEDVKKEIGKQLCTEVSDESTTTIKTI